MRSKLFHTLLSVAAFSLSVSGIAATSGNIGAQGIQVLSNLHHANQMEVQMGQTALKKASTSQVRDFGHKLVDDHRAADQKVMDLAKSENLDIQEQQPSAMEQSRMKYLEGLSGPAFDRAFVAYMTQDHNHDIRSLSSAEKSVKNDKIDGLISELLPTLQSHRDIAVNLSKTLQLASRSGASTG